MTPEVFVAGLHLRWTGVWQRPHHLLTRLARQVPVVVLEEPLVAAEDRDEVLHVGDLTVVRPLRRRGWAPPFVDDRALATLRGLVSDRTCGAWLYTPMQSELIDAFAAGPIVYDVMDDLAGFDFAPAGLAERERALLARADVVFAGGATLYEQRRAAGVNVHCFPSGVEPERFAVDVAPHPLTLLRGGPIFAYVGVIDERLDYGLIAALAEVFSAGHVLLVGPVVKVDPHLLPQRANVHFPTRLAYNALPALLSGCDVALMPFALNRATAAISPTKTLEYFAARRPVVSTPIADVVRSYGDIAYIAPAVEPFLAAVREALTVPSERLDRGLEAARAQTWDAIFARMWAAVTE